MAQGSGPMSGRANYESHGGAASYSKPMAGVEPFWNGSCRQMRTPLAVWQIAGAALGLGAGDRAEQEHLCDRQHSCSRAALASSFLAV
jgi:hypothetical protein